MFSSIMPDLPIFLGVVYFTDKITDKNSEYSRCYYQMTLTLCFKQDVTHIWTKPRKN